VNFDDHAADVDFDRGEREELAGVHRRHPEHGDQDRARFGEG
jgi:hypothetical protein